MVKSKLLFAGALLDTMIVVSCSTLKEEDEPLEVKIKPLVERQAAPDFALKDASGATAKLADYKDKVVLLNFWATW